MPVPGSLKRQPIDADEVARTLEEKFNLPRLEARAYLFLLERKRVGIDELAEALVLTQSDSRGLLETMISRGLIIRAPGSKETFSALHPRMTLTNIFKLYEREIIRSLKDRRATIDRVVNLLTPIYEDEHTGRS